MALQIIGAGFGGLDAARKLAKAPVQVTVIDRHNYHLFQPLLYQVAIAGLVPSQIAYPLRDALANAVGARVLGAVERRVQGDGTVREELRVSRLLEGNR